MTGVSDVTRSVGLRLVPESPGVLWVSMNAPPVNALGPELRQGLIDAAARAGEPDVAVVVLEGGEHCFSAGGDVAELSGIRDEATARAVHGHYLSLYREWRTIPVPTIAAIRSYALGGALELALCCDIRYAQADSFVAASGVGMGLLESAHSLPGVVGPGFAAEMLFTARRVDAEEAATRGLVDRVTDRLEDDVMALAESIGSHSRAALSATKSTMSIARSAGQEAASHHAVEQWRALRASPDHAKVVAAFRGRPGPRRRR